MALQASSDRRRRPSPRRERARRGAAAGFGLLLAAGLATACSSPPAPDVVAVSRLGQITRPELEAFIVSLPEEERRPPAGEALEGWRLRQLQRLLVQRELERQAREDGLLATPEAVELLRARREPLLVEEVRQRRVREHVRVDEEELRRFYDSHPEEFGHGEQIRLRNIYRRVARDAPAAERQQARELMEELHRQLEAGAHFGDLARAYSQSETAALEGLIGRLNRGDLDPGLEGIVWRLAEGEISDVISTPVGFHIFKLENHLPPFRMPFEEARGRLLRRFTRQRTEVAMSAYFAELLAASGAVYHPEGLASDDPSTLLFSLGDETVTLGDWQNRVAARPFYVQRDTGPSEQLHAMAEQRLLLWDAGRRKIDQESEVAARLAREERQIAIGLALRKWRQEAIAGLDDGALRAVYEQEASRLQTPKLSRLRLLTRSFPAESDAGQWYRVYEELAALAAEIRAGRRELATAARELSSDLSAPRGGDVGFIRMDSFAEWAGPRAQNAVLELGVGEVSDPILIERYDRSTLTYDRAGYMLVEVTEVQEPRPRSFDEIRDLVVERYLAESSFDLEQQIRERVLAAIDARFYERNL